MDCQKKILVVGVDFGTSYTGVAYALSNDPDPSKIEVITQWPGVGSGNESITLFKAPSEISYASTPNRWGYNFLTGMPRYGWFKLLLDVKAGERAYNDSNLETAFDPGNPNAILSLAPGKTAEDMCADYLKLVYDHAMFQLRRRMPNMFDETPIQFILTTPGMWDHNAQLSTQKTAERAGFGTRAGDKISTVSEPEAAAAYSLKMMNRMQAGERDGWEVGNQIIVCDAGGGTVDLVTYEIEQVTPFLKVVQSVQPKGGFCGATALDRAFLNLVRERLGPQSSKLDVGRAGRGSTLMKSFESVKRGFSRELVQDEYIEHGIVNIDPDLDRRIETQYIVFSHKQIQSIFDPVVDKVIKLVEYQARMAWLKLPPAPVRGVVLVGGFGESIYLYQRLEEWTKEQSPRLFIHNPSDCWPAVVKGAVSYGLEPIVTSRKLPSHYGIKLNEPYNSLVHDVRYTVMDNFDGILRSADTVTWFAAMGEDAGTDRRINVPFLFTTEDLMGYMNLKLVTCKYNETPTSFRDAKTLKLPELTIPLSGLPASGFKSKEVGTQTLYRGNFTLEMVFEGASLRWEVCHGGRCIETHRF